MHALLAATGGGVLLPMGGGTVPSETCLQLRWLPETYPSVLYFITFDTGFSSYLNSVAMTPLSLAEEF